MRKEILYQYLGKNGTLTTPILLEGIYNVKKVRLIADNKKKLTKDNIVFTSEITIPEDEVSEWYEVNA